MTRHPMPRHGRNLVLGALLASAAPLAAQPAEPPEADEAATAPAPAPAEAGGQGARTYTPEDFARFAPRNALEMLRQVPGFTIDSGDNDRRGLGQASANILINGQRHSGKSTDVVTELGRIPAANVERIEIVDGATIDVPGLSGQVANVVVRSSGISGTFAWRPQYRPNTDQLRLLNGEISVSGSLAGFDYTAALSNDSFVFGNAGPEIVFTPGGAIIDLRDEVLLGGAERPRISGSVSRTFGDGSVLNANAALGFEWFELEESSLRSGPLEPDRDRRLFEERDEWSYEVGGDYEFGLGGGQLKLIGLKRFEHSPFDQRVIVAFADGRPAAGDRFSQIADESETIVRGEYRWSGGGDWQVSAEGALNSLDVDNALFSLSPTGEWVAIPFPNSTATVEEKRGEAAISYGRPLADNLSVQSSLGAEYSVLEQSGAGGLGRRFFRPKGFVSVAWRPSPSWDLSARIERAVGQLNFFDFVASANVSGGTTNAGNAELVPPQSWDGELRATRSLGPWGTATARLYGRLISDIVDIIPIGDTGQSPGNLDSATVYGIHWTSTFNFDPIGIPGAKLDLDLQFQKSSLDDPLTGLPRPINENMTRRVVVNFRHDVPATDWAYGAVFDQFRQAEGFRLDQRFHFVNEPGILGVFVENKDVMGLTVRAAVDNLLDTNERFERSFFDGRRTNALLFTEDRDRFFGPIFTLSISGSI